jgi:hypothetical protein
VRIYKVNRDHNDTLVVLMSVDLQSHRAAVVSVSL